MHLLPRNKLRNPGVILMLSFVSQCSNSVQPEGPYGTPTFDYRQLSEKISTLDLGFDLAYQTSGDREGTHIAVAQADRVMVVDVEDPYAPTVVHSIPIPRGVRDVQLTETHLFVVGTDGLQIFDRDDPLGAPVAQWSLASRESPGPLLVDGQCFLATSVRNDDWLYIFDVVDVRNPVEVAKVPLEATATDLVRVGDLLVVGTYGRAVVLDVGDPLHVEVLSTAIVGSHVAIQNGLAYVSPWYGSGVTVFDLQDPRHPVQVGSASIPQITGPMQAIGDRLYVRSNNLVEILDISNPLEPVRQTSLASWGWGRAFVHEDFVWSVGSALVTHRLRAEATVPVLGERSFLDQSIYYSLDVLCADNDRLIVSTSQGLLDLPVSDPTLDAPGRLLEASGWPATLGAGRLYLRSDPRQIEVRDLASQRTLEVVDLTPILLKARDRISWLQAQEGRLYVIVSDEIYSRYELQVFDVDLQGRLTLVGRLYREGNPEADLKDVQLDGQTLYVLFGTYGAEGSLDVLDVHDGHRPQLQSSTRIEYPGNHLTTLRGFVYVDALEGMLSLDVRDPRAPLVTSRLPDVRGVVGLVARERSLYAMQSHELVILDLSRPADPVAIASVACASGDLATDLIGTDRCLLAVRGRRIEAWPFHASQR